MEEDGGPAVRHSNHQTRRGRGAPPLEQAVFRQGKDELSVRHSSATKNVAFLVGIENLVVCVAPTILLL